MLPLMQLVTSDLDKHMTLIRKMEKICAEILKFELLSGCLRNLLAVTSETPVP